MNVSKVCGAECFTNPDVEWLRPQNFHLKRQRSKTVCSGNVVDTLCSLFADMQEDVIKCFWCFVNSPTSSSLCTHESRSMFMLCGDAIANVYAVVCRTENGNYKMSIRMDRLVYAC